MECFHDQELKPTDKGHSRAMDADSRAGQTTGQENLAVLQEEEAPPATATNGSLSTLPVPAVQGPGRVRASLQGAQALLSDCLPI